MNNERLTFWEFYAVLDAKIKIAIWAIIATVLIAIFLYFAWFSIFTDIIGFVYTNLKIIQPIISFISTTALLWYIAQSSKVTAFMKLFLPKHLKDMEDRIMAKIEQVEADVKHSEQVQEERLAQDVSNLEAKIHNSNGQVLAVNQRVTDTRKQVANAITQSKVTIDSISAKQNYLQGVIDKGNKDIQIVLEILTKGNNNGEWKS